MFARNGKIKGLFSGTPEGSPPAAEDAWDVVLRFAHEVPSYSQTPDLIRLTLDAVCRGVRADAAFWHARGCPEAFALAGERLPAAWCRSFAEKLLSDAPGVESQLLRATLPPPADRTQPAPASAALVQVSKSNQIWLVALSLTPQRPFACDHIKVMAVLRQVLLNQMRRTRMYSRMSETMFWLVQCLTATIDARLPNSGAHSERVAQLAVRLGQQMKLPPLVLSDIYFAGLLHDIGKTGVSESLLHKPGRLTELETAQIQEYPVIGDRILSGIDQLKHLRPAVRNHRERFDGRGYPDRLAGQDIPLMARVLAVADAYDAMLSPRPYRAPLSATRANTVLTDGAGTMWDPDVIRSFGACRSDLYAICTTNVAGGVSPTMHSVVATWGAGSSQTLPRLEIPPAGPGGAR